MEKEKFNKPLVEVIVLSDDIICTSEGPVNPFDPWDDDDPGTDAW